MTIFFCENNLKEHSTTFYNNNYNYTLHFKTKGHILYAIIMKNILVKQLSLYPYKLKIITIITN